MSKADLESLHLAELHARAAAAGVSGYRLMPREELVEALSNGDTDAPAKPRRRRRRRGGGGEGGKDEGGGGRARQRQKDDGEKEKADDDEEPPKDTGEPVSGVLDVLSQGHGFVRLNGLEPAEGDVYISASQIRRCELRSGDEVAGPARQPRRGERHPALVRVEQVNGAEPVEDRGDAFEQMTPVAPSRRIPLAPAQDDVLVRAVDLLTPLAFGQRVLIHSQPRSGRTTLLRGLTAAIAAAPDRPGIIVLLVDERPEEVTEWRREVADAEIAAAAADLSASEQVRHADLAMARAKRRAERGEDVVVLVDSLTRLGVAHGDPAAVKPLFGAGRELEEEGSGSLTVIATVLSETEDGDGAEEAVKTTENVTLALDPELAAAGVVPALDVAAASVAGEEKLRDEAELAAVRALREELRGLEPRAAAELLSERIRGSASNSELLGG